ncbi:hypothetical protein GCM10010218_48070 [Streptomyces mashuensis]|uniref:Putative Flp pilus-assembly TadG-like N-terminal domain-containing protein n=1 Tax=Streptomyces mashuensis TaxID=33904 RepID=A0A919EEY3_9ACTN|nr:pilus assembly protein TadG-related protein [Streptomyces mashuensis]GHF60934.1 hypothetical protein GCM10010218_48070 [Streptomyces mashuensis]
MRRAAARSRRDRRGGRDAGQAFPLYVVAVAALLFLAFALFAVGRAGAARNGAQTAADAAALAAAQDYRDQLLSGFLAALTAPGPAPAGGWADWLAGRGADTALACRAASEYAGLNGARPEVSCAEGAGPGSFDVAVTAARPVGPSVVPGTEEAYATARARATVTPRCEPAPGAPTPTPTPPSTSAPTPSPSASPAGPALVTLLCDGRPLTVDPRRPGNAPPAADLFAVRLTD